MLLPVAVTAEAATLLHYMLLLIFKYSSKFASVLVDFAGCLVILQTATVMSLC